MRTGSGFRGEIISHCVWLYRRFTIALRDIELRMAARGIDSPHCTVIVH
ncbi:hypothetical protein R3Q06_31450 [Rhodococcus erythropolis]|nr:hypothetical protein [Rhodococcus erythropolis]MDV6278002.1 hypothetical protein [Rhodococcus erythropolis]